MSAQPFKFTPTMDDIQLRNTLVRRCALSDEVVSKIAAAQRMLDTSFVEAAMRLGYVSQEDVDDALAWDRKIALLEKKPARPSTRLIIAHDPYDARSEKIRALRTELLLRCDQQDSGNIIAVLSACQGEGRSQLAAELAIAFSQLGQPTLLVDADMRNPQQHVLFSAENKRGLAQALAMDDSPYIHPVDGLPKMSLLTAGPAPSNPLELLSDRRFESLTEEWRRQYQFVIVDTAPVSKYADALAVSTVVGQVLMVSRAKATSFKNIKDTMRRLMATQAQVMGAVINHF